MFILYGIYHKEEDLWFNVRIGEWTYNCSGECLFPTYEMAKDYMLEFIHESLVKVYEVEIPQKELNYIFSPVREK